MLERTEALAILSQDEAAKQGVQHTRIFADRRSVVDGLDQALSLDLKRQGGDSVLWLVEGVESVVDSGDVVVDVANGLGNGGTGALVELCGWRGQGQCWEEEV